MGDPGSTPGWQRSPGEGNGYPVAKITPVILPGEPHGRRSPVGYSLWGSQRVGHDSATNTFTFFRFHTKITGSDSLSKLPLLWEAKGTRPPRCGITPANLCAALLHPGPQKPRPACETAPPFPIILSGVNHAVGTPLTVRGGCPQCGVRRACGCGLRCLRVWAQSPVRVGPDGHGVRRGRCPSLAFWGRAPRKPRFLNSRPGCSGLCEGMFITALE